MQNENTELYLSQKDGVHLAITCSSSKLAPSTLDSIRETFGETYFESLNKKAPFSRLTSQGAAALLLSLCRDCSLNEHDLTIERNCYGKPYFKFLPSVSFSISHDQKTQQGVSALLVSLSTAGNIGADIMLLPSTLSYEARLHIAHRFLNVEDIATIVSGGTEESFDGKLFSALWTQREAYSKLLGGRLADVLAIPFPKDITFITECLTLGQNELCYSICRRVPTE